jgi:hypothetical protein
MTITACAVIDNVELVLRLDSCFVEFVKSLDIRAG